MCRDSIVGNHFKGSAAVELAKVLAEWMSYSAEGDERIVQFVLAFSPLVNALKIKPAEVKEFAAARKELERFEKANGGKL